MIWRIIKLLMATMIFGSLLTFVIMVDYQEVISQIRKVRFGFIWILLLSFLSHLSGSIAWHYCFNNSEKLSFFKLFFIRTIGENVSLFNPTNIVGGEATKYVLLESIDLSRNDKWDSILISRILMVFSQLLIAIICAIWMLHKVGYVVEGILIVMSASFLFWIAYLATCRFFVKFDLQKNFRIEFFNDFKKKAKESLRRISKFGINRRSEVFNALSFSLLHWILGAIEIFVILTYLGVMPNLLDCMVVDTGVVIIKSIGGFIPGQIGVEEIGNKWMLALTGVQGAMIWVSVSIIRRTKQLFWILFSVVGYFMIFKIQKTKTKTNGNLVYNA